MTSKITIERIRIGSHWPDGMKKEWVTTVRVYNVDYLDTEYTACQLLTAFITANPGTLATYTITGCSAADEGSRW